jgi:transposase
VTNKSRGTFVLLEPCQIVQALVGLKDVRLLAYQRFGPEVELLVEQSGVVKFCSACGARAQVKDRPVVRFVDLPVFGQPMRLAWRKHRLKCRQQPNRIVANVALVGRSDVISQMPVNSVPVNRVPHCSDDSRDLSQWHALVAELGHALAHQRRQLAGPA